MYSGASPCNPVPENGLQKSQLRCRPLAFLSFCCNVGKLPRLSGDSHFAFFYLLNSQTRPVQRPDLQPETKTEPQPRSHWPRLIVRARATDTRSRRGAKDSEQKTCSSIILPEEREESRKRSKVEKREKTLFLSQASTLPHAALVTMVGNKKEEPWLWTKGCPSLAASRLSLVSVPRGRSQQQQERQRAKGG